METNHLQHPHEIFPSGFASKYVSIGVILFYAAMLPDKRCSIIQLNLSTECFGSNLVPHLQLFGQYFKSVLFDVNGKAGVKLVFC